MHNVPRGLHLAAGPLLAVALLAAACGGGGSATPSGTTTPFGTTTPSGTTGVNQRLAERGAELFTQFGCNTCHSTTGQRIVGPPLNGLYGKQVQLENGQTVTADEAYLRESILDPDAKIVAGYPKGVMASTIADRMNQIRQDDNVDALVEYIKSLR